MELATLTARLETSARFEALARALWCKASADLPNGMPPQELYRREFGTARNAFDKDALAALDVVSGALMQTKAAVSVGTVTPPSWATPLAKANPLFDGFEAAIRRGLALTRAGCARIPFVIPTPFVASNSGPAIPGVSEVGPKPTGVLGFSSITLMPRKIGRIVVVSDELARASAPQSALALERLLTAALIRATDSMTFDAVAATPARPAGILNGVVATTPPAGASTVDQLRAVLTALATSRPETAAPVVVTSPAVAMTLPLDPGADISTGVVLCRGARIVLAPVGSKLIAFDALALAYASGDAQLDSSREATVQLDDAPASPIDATTVMTSLWQQNLTAFLAELWCSWAIVPGAVAFADVV